MRVTFMDDRGLGVESFEVSSKLEVKDLDRMLDKWMEKHGYQSAKWVIKAYDRDEYSARECIEYAISCLKNRDSRGCTIKWLERALAKLEASDEQGKAAAAGE